MGSSRSRWYLYFLVILSLLLCAIGQHADSNPKKENSGKEEAHIQHGAKLETPQQGTAAGTPARSAPEPPQPDIQRGGSTAPPVGRGTKLGPGDLMDQPGGKHPPFGASLNVEVAAENQGMFEKMMEENLASEKAQKPRGLFKKYDNLLRRHYLSMSFAQATVLGVLGDLLAQGIELRLFRRSYNVKRTMHVGFLTMLIDGLATPHYYNALELISEKRTMPVVLLKTFIGTAIFGPVANGVFLAGVPLLQHGLDIVKMFNFASWKHQLLVATIRDLQIWPLLDMLNFKLLPKHWRPLASSLAALGVITFLGFATGFSQTTTPFQWFMELFESSKAKILGSATK